MGWCWLRADSAELMLQQLSAEQQIRLNPAIGQSWVLYITPDDLDALHARLRSAGFPVSDIARTSYGSREFFAPDPDGYELWVSDAGGSDGRGGVSTQSISMVRCSLTLLVESSFLGALRQLLARSSAARA